MQFISLKRFFLLCLEVQPRFKSQNGGSLRNVIKLDLIKHKYNKVLHRKLCVLKSKLFSSMCGDLRNKDRGRRRGKRDYRGWGREASDRASHGFVWTSEA